MNMIDPAALAAFQHAERHIPAGWHQPFVIYALKDPETGLLRYIGKTTRPAQRYRDHLRERSRSHRGNWIAGLASRGLAPGMVFLEMVEGAGDPNWEVHERWWIAYARAHGWPLVNGTSGGDGVRDLSPESRERIRQAWVGRELTPEHKAKISAYRKTWRASDETRARMSASHQGRKITWIDKIAAANRKIDAAAIVEIRARLAAGEKVGALASEFGVHRTTLSKIKAGTYLLPGQVAAE